MNESIMPLVEENRKLHDEVRALKQSLTEQNIRLDELLNQSQYKPSLRYVDVEVPQHMHFLNPAEAMRDLSRRLADKMMGEIPRMAMRVEAPALLGADRVYRFAFLKVGK